MSKVIYDPLEQEHALLPIYNDFKSEVVAGKLKPPRPPGLIQFGDPVAEQRYEQEKNLYIALLKRVTLKILLGFGKLYTLKNGAFSEEKEWRLISFLSRGSDDRCQYRAATNRLVPYRGYGLKQLAVPAISEVILGPKNTTPEFVVEKMLAQYGFLDVTVKRSSATYR